MANDKQKLKKLKIIGRKKICLACERDVNAPLFDGCMYPPTKSGKCPLGYKPCV